MQLDDAEKDAHDGLPVPCGGSCPDCGLSVRQAIPSIVDPDAFHRGHGITEYQMSYTRSFRLRPCGHTFGSIGLDRSVEPPAWHYFKDRGGADEWLRRKGRGVG